MKGMPAIREDVPIAPYTTLGLGGRARRFVEPRTRDELVEAVQEADASRDPLFVLGGGSNVVAGDDGWPGTVLAVRARRVAIDRAGSRARVNAEAGASWPELVDTLVGLGARALPFLAGIPGTVGATPIQNVGAYGEEVASIIREVEIYDREEGRALAVAANDCGFRYRSSRFRRNARYVVLRVVFDVELGSETVPVRYEELARELGVPVGGVVVPEEARQAVLALRRKKGMVVDPVDPESQSAGSFFVNPIVSREDAAEIARRAGVEPPKFDVDEGHVKVPAAWLIERAGFEKGHRVGGVGISRKHALALVHYGGATTRELLALARAIRDGVRARFGVTLEPEPVLYGAALGDDERSGHEPGL